MSFLSNLFGRRLPTIAKISLIGSTLISASIAQTPTPKLAQDCSAYASVPLPAEAETFAVNKTAPACASYRSYRGIGRPVDFAAARACAWRERLAGKADLGQNQKEPIAWVVGGSLILADIYYNGSGVKKNIPLAMRLACELKDGTGQHALEEFAKGLPRWKGPFEFCDYAFPTFSANFCMEYSSEIEDERRNKYYESLKQSMTAQQKQAFESLLAAEKAYVMAHADEVDQGGTIRNQRTMTSRKILADLFRIEIAHFENKEWPNLADAHIADADSLVSRRYEKTRQALRKQTKEQLDEGAVSADGLAKAERAWEIYRDAWTAFAHVRYQGKEAAIKAQIEMDRYRLLKTI